MVIIGISSEKYIGLYYRGAPKEPVEEEEEEFESESDERVPAPRMPDPRPEPPTIVTCPKCGIETRGNACIFCGKILRGEGYVDQ